MSDPIAELRKAVPAGIFRPVQSGYLTEPRGKMAGKAGLVAAPRSVEEVQALVIAAAELSVPIIPYGGGTGLVGGQVSPDPPAPLVLSLERMTRLRAIYPDENVLIVEAGAILSDVQAAAEAEALLFPLSLASEGSARIGGLLSTNAGGVGVLRYGNARDLCLGLEAVLPDGQVYRGLSRLRKDNTGYDLRNLLIGAEGTLGVITAAALKLFPRPAERATALVAVPNPAAALSLLTLARTQAGETLSAFELISGQGPAFLAETLPDIRLPLNPAPDWAVLLEIGARGAQASMEELVSAAMETGLVEDGVLAQSETQRSEIWGMREHIPLANRAIGAIGSHDISLPLSQIPDFISEMPARLGQLADVRINCFGHLGDGNLHYNLFPTAGRGRETYHQVRAALTDAIHEAVVEKGGSISAEHGIGRFKVADLERFGDPTKLGAMRAIKQALDPKGIMNPGAVLRSL